MTFEQCLLAASSGLRVRLLVPIRGLLINGMALKAGFFGHVLGASDLSPGYSGPKLVDVRFAPDRRHAPREWSCDPAWLELAPEQR